MSACPSEQVELLLTAEDIKREGAAIAPWARAALDSFWSTVASQSPVFPCFYASRALHAGALRYVLVDDTSPESMARFAQALARYAETAEEIGRFTALLAFFPPDPVALSREQYDERFWRILQYLCDHDPAPWPSHIPLEPDEQLWEFCFNREPMFVLGSNPAYVQRKTRLTSTLTISFQPRFMFDRLIERPSLLARARALIRKRANTFDGIPVHPQIGMYYETDNREWRQYVVPDTNELIQGRCPLEVGGGAHRD